MGTPPPRRYDLVAPTLPEGPIDLPSLIPGDEPLELDVGFGRGRSLIERARAIPRVRVIGIEIKAKWSYLCEERRRREGQGNARAFRADVRDLVSRAGPQGCLSRVFFHFPDPWWKKRHERRLVVGSDVIDRLAFLIAPGGEIFVQTDVEERAEQYAALFAAHEALEIVSRGGQSPFGTLSNREARAIEDGLPIHRILVRRR